MNPIRRQSDASPTIVRIIGANRKPCDACCGPGSTEEELTDSIRVGLAQRYGDHVQVSYHSLLDPATEREFAPLLASARAAAIPFPIVAIDGSVVQGGGISFHAVVNAVDLKREMAEQ